MKDNMEKGKKKNTTCKTSKTNQNTANTIKAILLYFCSRLTMLKS